MKEKNEIAADMLEMTMERYKYFCKYESKNHSEAPTAVSLAFINLVGFQLRH